MTGPMEVVEDPVRRGTELLDCLRQTGRPLAILIGAGCPCSLTNAAGAPLIPDVEGLTEVVDQELSTGTSKATWTNLKAQLLDDGRTAPNIEDYLSRVRGLRLLVGNSNIRGLTSTELADLEASICSIICRKAAVDLPGGNNAYTALARWIRGARRGTPVQVFTTNYDLLVEQALEQGQLPYFDGFVGSVNPFFSDDLDADDELPASWVRLWKLHGSINWSTGTIEGRRAVIRCKTDAAALIHPSHLKYDESRKMPYLAMLERLRRFLRHPSSVLVTVGYSFRDEHLNEVMVGGVRSNPQSMVFGLLYGDLKNYVTVKALSSVASNLNFLAEDGMAAAGKEFLWETVDEDAAPRFPPGIIRRTNEGTTFRQRLGLGDFGKFGMMLDYISGTRSTGLDHGS